MDGGQRHRIQLQIKSVPHEKLLWPARSHPERSLFQLKGHPVATSAPVRRYGISARRRYVARQAGAVAGTDNIGLTGGLSGTLASRRLLVYDRAGCWWRSLAMPQ